MRGGRRHGSLLAALTAGALIVIGAPEAAHADAFPNNRYAIDLFQGPVLAPIRLTGMSGAYGGHAEGIEGMVANAAAPAVREPFSASWFEFDISGSISIPLSLFENNDFDNSGANDSDYSNFVYLTGGVLSQFGMFGVGANAELQRYSLTSADGASTAVTVGKYHGLAAIRLVGDQLMIGAGARLLTLGLDAPDTTLTTIGAAPQIGILIRPDWTSFRIGATYRFAVDAGELVGGARSRDAAGRARAGGLILPDRVVWPWELEVGVAIQVGPRPLNPVWIDPHEQEEEIAATQRDERAERAGRDAAEIATIADPGERARRAAELAEQERAARGQDERRFEQAKARLKRERRARYWNWPRQHLLLLVDLLASGGVDGGVKLADFLGQNETCRDRPEAQREACRAGLPSIVGSSGSAINFSPRVGIETEPVPSVVKTRFGTYYEPSRNDDARVGRQHFTFGADLKLFPTTWWGLVPQVIYKAQASFDIAPRYQSLSAGIGVWR